MSGKAPKYLTTNQVADILGLTPGTLRSWRIRKQGPPYLKIGVLCRYDESELNEWIKQKCFNGDGD